MWQYFRAPKAVELVFYTRMVSVDAAEDITTDPPLAPGDFLVSLDGGVFQPLDTTPAAEPAAGVAIKVLLSALEMDADHVVVAAVDPDGAWKDQFFHIFTTPHQANVVLVGDDALEDIAVATRDTLLVGAAEGSMGEALTLLLGFSAKRYVRYDNFQRNATTGFLEVVRVRIFSSSALAAASTAGNESLEDGEVARLVWTGVAGEQFTSLPDSIVTGDEE